MAMTAQGYTQREIARMVGCSTATVTRVIDRVKRRTPAEDAKSWRQVQLPRLERLYEACARLSDEERRREVGGVHQCTS